MTSKLTNNNSNNNNNNFIYTAKIDQLNLNIKTAGINLCTVDKIFQISVSNKKYQKKVRFGYNNNSYIYRERVRKK